MVNISRRRAFTARRLILLATIANLGIAAVVVSGAFVPTFSKAQAAEKSESNSPFPPNSRMEEFFRRFAMPDASRDDWWQRDFPSRRIPRSSGSSAALEWRMLAGTRAAGWACKFSPSPLISPIAWV